MKGATCLVLALACAHTVLAGDSMESYENGPSGNNCRCGNSPRSNPCLTNPGPNVPACVGLNAYIQCSPTLTCTPLACPPGQVWTAATATAQAGCAICPVGQHIRLDGTRCVCNTNTTLGAGGVCVPCPGGAVVGNDLCYCPVSTRLDKVNNLCRACPAGTFLGGDSGCTCLDRTTLFNPSTWTCGLCPGTWLVVSRSGRQACRCTTPGQIVNKATLTCFTCPSPTFPDRDNDSCVCGGLFQKFDMVSQRCVCQGGTQLNPTTGACQFPPVVAPANPPQARVP